MPGLVAGLRALARSHRGIVSVVWGAAVLLVAGDAWLLDKRFAYARETTRLRDGLSAVERSRLDAALQSDSNRVQVMIELARRQARGDALLHLAIAVDSGVMHLEQEGAVLRSVAADVGPEAWVRTSARDSMRVAAPRGARTIERVLGDSTVVLSGGALIYARSPGDTARAARPGSVRVDAGELRVLRASLRVGQRVYFY